MIKQQITSFLRQRLAAAKKSTLPNSKVKQRTIEQLIMSFDLIRDMPDRRHAIELWRKSNEFISILPSPHGRHASVRNRMLDLIYESRTLITQP